MTNKEIEEVLNSLSNKIDRLSNLEDRLEKSWNSVEKYRNSMVYKGFSYPMIEEFNKAIQPVQQYVNTIRNLRKKEAMLKQEVESRKMAEKEMQRQRFERFPYNTKCRNFYISDGDIKCEVNMDMCFCNDNCPYCTNRTGSYIVNQRGNVVGHRKYSTGGRT